jgi:enamine deaminase RidA (YjgF/YER057c/UK114 family)
MNWRYVTTGSDFEKRGGFSRVMHDDEWVFVSGTTGFDYSTMSISADFADQVRQTWTNIESALAAAGSSLGEIVSFLIVLTDRADYPKLIELGTFMPHHPSGTLIVAQLLDPRMKIEIQVTAKRQGMASS